MAALAWFKEALIDKPDGSPLASGAATPASKTELDQDAEFWGLDASALKPAQARLEGLAAFDGVFEQHLSSVEAFLLCNSQWRSVGAISAESNGGIVYHGIDYCAAEIAWQHHDLDIDAEVFAGFQVIETEATRLLNGGAA